MFTCDRCGNDFEDEQIGSNWIADRYGFFEICENCADSLLEDDDHE